VIRTVLVQIAFVLPLTGACASYTGTARTVSPAILDDDPGWLAVRDVPYLSQQSDADCGAAAIGMMVSYWTGALASEVAASLRPVPAQGIKAGRLRDFARDRGLASFLIAGELDDLAHELSRGRPVLVGLVKPQRKGTLDHYEVVIGLHRARGLVITLDPASGWRRNTIQGFLAEWQPAGRLSLIVSAASPSARRAQSSFHEHQASVPDFTPLDRRGR
jgi:ABC-type bacteriocin/lantibiotic exporter with double-glycine peptidase domain